MEIPQVDPAAPYFFVANQIGSRIEVSFAKISNPGEGGGSTWWEGTDAVVVAGPGSGGAIGTGADGERFGRGGPSCRH